MVEKQLLANERTAKKLIKLMKGKNIAQISISDGKSHISVKQKVGSAKVITAPWPVPVLENSSAVSAPEKAQADQQELIRSENIGTFHLKQKGKLLCELGQVCEKGSKLALINAMKIDNEVVSPFKCRIQNILVKENSIVEYGSVLFALERL